MLLSINRNNHQLTSLISKLYSILVIMGEQDQWETPITSQEIEEWLSILERVQQEHKLMKQKLSQNKGKNQ
jgi:hypothetical protein